MTIFWLKSSSRLCRGLVHFNLAVKGRMYVERLALEFIAAFWGISAFYNVAVNRMTNVQNVRRTNAELLALEFIPPALLGGCILIWLWNVQRMCNFSLKSSSLLCRVLLYFSLASPFSLAFRSLCYIIAGYTINLVCVYQEYQWQLHVPMTSQSLSNKPVFHHSAFFSSRTTSESGWDGQAIVLFHQTVTNSGFKKLSISASKFAVRICW